MQNIIQEKMHTTKMLFIDILIHPKRVFQSIKGGRLTYEIYAVFILCVLITYVKSLFKPGVSGDYFVTNWINEICNFVQRPYVELTIVYLLFFLYISLVFAACKLFYKKAIFKTLLLSFLSISSIGVVVHILYFLISAFFTIKFHPALQFTILFWVIGLEFIAVKLSQDISIGKTFICMLIPAIPFIVLYIPLVFAPYLAWVGEPLFDKLLMWAKYTLFI